jgi:hypothetical protein
MYDNRFLEAAMTVPDRTLLLHRLDETRSKIEELLPKIDHDKEIYPGWTIKDMLAHISGWDEATIDSLRAHVAGRNPLTPAEKGVDEYNTRTVSSRQDLDYAHVLNEWRLTRQVLHTILEQMSDKNFFEPLIAPWGEEVTVISLVETFCDHEKDHAQDILEWLMYPEKPLLKRVN